MRIREAERVRRLERERQSTVVKKRFIPNQLLLQYKPTVVTPRKATPASVMRATTNTTPSPVRQDA